MADETLAEEILQQLVELEIKPEKEVGKNVRQQVFKILCSLSESQFKTQALQLLEAQSDFIASYQLLQYRAVLDKENQDDDSRVRIRAAEVLVKLGKTSDKILPRMIKWLEQHQESEFIGNGIDVLWDLVVEE